MKYIDQIKLEVYKIYSLTDKSREHQIRIIIPIEAISHIKQELDLVIKKQTNPLFDEHEIISYYLPKYLDLPVSIWFSTRTDQIISVKDIFNNASKSSILFTKHI